MSERKEEQVFSDEYGIDPRTKMQSNSNTCPENIDWISLLSQTNKENGTNLTPWGIASKQHEETKKQ